MSKMVIEVLFPEYNNLYGDRGNCEYLSKKLSLAGYEVEVIETSLFEKPAFIDSQVDFLLIGPCQEKHQLVEIAELKKYADKKIYICGDGYDIAKNAFTKIETEDTPLIHQYQSAYSVALCALEATKQELLTTDIELSPIYLRASQAERERLERLEEIANSFNGVEKSFAIQAGREVRIMVKPDKVNDDETILLAKDIVKKIESTMEYPGQIKVNVIREMRTVEYAK